MASEAKRGFVRVATNYLRLFASIVSGLILVRLLISAAGEDGWALVALFGSTIGIAAMLLQIVRECMVRELGVAHHSNDAEEFKAVYNSALVVSFLVALLAGGIFAILYILIPYFKVEGMESAARALVMSGGIQIAVLVALAPVFNMYLVTERMVAYNFWLFLIERGASLIGAIWAALTAMDGRPEEAIITYAWVGNGGAVVVQVLCAVCLIAIDRRLIPKPQLFRWSAFRSILSTSGWNAMVVLAMNLHLRTNAVIINLGFGLFASRVFGYAVQLTGYARRLAMGMTDGLDAVATRMSGDETQHSLQRLVTTSTRMHGIVSFPASIVIFILGGKLLLAWVGDLPKFNVASVDPTIHMIRIIVIGTCVRSIADGWVRLLYGAGYVKKYAPVVLLGGIANPLLALILIWIVPKSEYGWQLVAIAFSAIMVIVHGIVLPIIGSRCLGIRLSEMFLPLIRPLLATAIASPILLYQYEQEWSLLQLGLTLTAFSVVYGLLTWFFVLTREDRKLFTNAARRRLGQG